MICIRITFRTLKHYQKNMKYFDCMYFPEILSQKSHEEKCITLWEYGVTTPLLHHWIISYTMANLYVDYFFVISCSILFPLMIL